MAEIINTGDCHIITKDWEKLLTAYKAELIRISYSGKVELLIDSKWHDMAEPDPPVKVPKM